LSCIFSIPLLHLLFCYHFIIISPHFSYPHLHLSIPFHTACRQYSYITRTSFTVLSIATCPCTYRCHNPFLLAFLLLWGDIELNPGPTNFTVCTLNIRSILTDSHSAALSGLIVSNHPDLICLTETRIKPTTILTELAKCRLLLLITHSAKTATFLETPQIRLELTLPVAPAFDS